MKKCISLFLVLAMILSLMPMVSFAAEAEVKEGIVTETVGDIRVQFLSPSMVRIEAKGPKGFEDQETFHIVNRTEWDGDTVTIEESEDEVVFTTTTSKVVIPTDSDITQCKIYDLDGVLIWEYQQLDSNKQDLPEFNEQVWAWQITDTPRVVPSEQGFAYVEGVTELSDTNGWDLENDAEDVYVFLPNNDHRQLREDFVNLTGRTEMLDLSALGIWDSRWWVYSQETALEQIDGYHDRNLPLDVLVVDTDWRKSSGTGIGYDINTELFPDMEQFFEDAHARNVSVMFNDHPEPTLDDNGVKNNVLKAEEVEYRQSNLTRLLEMGLDGWWYDRNWSTTVKALDEFTHEVMGMATYEAAYKTVYPESRLFQMANMDGNTNGQTGGASNIAAHRYGIHWTGDTTGYQELLLHEMETAIEYGEVSAIPYGSTDIGGFYTNSNSISDAEYVRWIQYSAFSPIFRLHCTMGAVGRMPWMWSDEAVDLTRDYMNLRYRLLPVFYQLSHENYETGMPLIRHMTADYPEYAGADRADQFLLGEDILVAPATTASRDLYFTNEYLTDPDGAAGVKAEYYNTVDLTGDVVLTETAKTINYSWGSNAPNSSVGTNKFSIRFSGNFTIPGEANSMVTLSMDEGARLYVDGELVIDNWDKSLGTYVFTDKVYEARSTHSFVLEYFDSTGSASVVLGCAAGDEELSAERTVWIPEGRWINAFTGEEICGPTTITISTKLDDMPLFIKAGSVIALADETLTTASSDWSHLTLDYYPSVSVEDTTEIYEDDTESVDYQNGKYRTTELTTGFEDGKATLTIAAAQGSFEGELAFTERDWTVRVHQPKGWGELTAVTDAKGNAVEFVKIDSDATAMALDNDGAAPDAVVYEIKLTSDIYEEQKLYFTFETPAEDTASGDETPVVAADVPVERSVTISDFPDFVNLSQEGTIDWIHVGYASGRNITRKSNDYEYIKFTEGEKAQRVGSDCPTAFAWNDSADGTVVNNCHKFHYTFYRDNPYEVTVTATQEEQILTLYLGGFYSYSRVTISDGTKGGTSVYQFGNNAGPYYKKVQIRLSAEIDTELHITYETVSVQSSSGNPAFYGATLAKAPEVAETPTVTASVEVTDSMPTTVDLTAEGTGDWLYGDRPNGQFVRKAGVTPAIEVSALTMNNMVDYKVAYTATDGTETIPSNRVNRGIYNSAWINARVAVSEKQETLKLYLGGWYSQGTLEIYDDAGKLLDTKVFENQSGSFYRMVTVQVSASADTYLNFHYACTAQYGGMTGNVTLSAVTYTGTAKAAADETITYSDDNYLLLSSGSYAGGDWTADDVTVALSARYPEKVASYQMKQGEEWVNLEGSAVTVSENGTHDLTFRYVDADGNASGEKSIQVNIDNVKPTLNVTRTKTDDNVIFAAEATAGETGATVYCRVDGGNWTVMTDDLTVSTESASLYRFKAVSGTGLETSVIALTTAMDEMEALKATALAELEAYRNNFDNADYREEQVAELDAAVADGKAAIEAAQTNEEVTAALKAAKAAMDAVITTMDALEKAIAAAEAAQKAAEDAAAAAKKASESAANDKSAAEAAKTAAETAKSAAETAKAAAEEAQAKAEEAQKAAAEQNTAAAEEAVKALEEAAKAATSASVAASAASTAAVAAASAQNAQLAAETAQTKAEAAQKAAEDAAATAAKDKTAAQAAADAAELAQTAAETAKAQAETAKSAAVAAAEAAEESNVEAAEEASAAAKAAADSAASAEAAATSATASAEAAKVAQAAQKAAEDAAAQAATDKAAAEKAKEEAAKAAAEAAVNLAKYVALTDLVEKTEELTADTTAEQVDELVAVSKAARDAIEAAETEEAVAEIIAAAVAEMEAITEILCAGEEFTDVDVNEWYHDAIDFVINEGMMSGNGDGTFAPEAELSRAMMVQILYNIEDKPEVETDKSFSDVTEDDWYYDAVMWAAENGIVLGKDDGTYAPNDNITREQMVTILWRYAGKPEAADAEITFADADAIDEYAQLAVAWAVENEIVKGVGDNRFNPDGNSKRSEAAQVMMNYFKK